MAEKDVTAVDEKDYEHHLTWRGWLSFIVVALSFSGVLKDMGPLSAFDFTVLTGKFGKIAEGATFIGKGGHWAPAKVLCFRYIIPDRYSGAGHCACGLKAAAGFWRQNALSVRCLRP